MNQQLREKRWRLVLGETGDKSLDVSLQGDEAGMDRCLAAVYGDNQSDPSRRGGLAGSAPKVTRWLGDIRQYFPASVVQVMQKDVIERLGLEQLLLEPEILETIEPDVHLIATLITLKHVIPAKTKETARRVVAGVVEELIKRLEQPMQQAIVGALNRSVRHRRPRLKEIDWHRTIRANMKNYLPDYKTIIPEIKIGFGRKRSSLRDIVLCVDQSGSMASSVVYSSIFAAVMASLPAVKTQLVVFDTSVVDLSDELQNDPVDLLFGVQLGGGTDINRAIGYCQELITRPEETILILISDLYEGGDQTNMLKRAASIKSSGVQFITLLALSDDGAPFYDHKIAAAYASIGIPTFACTPDKFPELMATAINKNDINEWAARENIVTTRGE